jgi:hypothetical protein
MGRLNGGHRGGRRLPWPDTSSGYSSRLPGRDVTHPDMRGFGVRKTVTLKGPLSETEQLRLRRAAEYCPVGQLLTKGALIIEDQVTYSAQTAAPEVAVSTAEVVRPPPDTLPTCPPGAIHGRYLVDTRRVRRQRSASAGRQGQALPDLWKPHPAGALDHSCGT